MAVVINELDVLVERPTAPATTTPRAASAGAAGGVTAHDLDEVARHLEARRARVRAD